jgi:hypothetical protein
MSTRLWLSGCSLDAIDSWMGSKDEECLSQILAYAEQYLDGKNEEDIELLESVKQLITELVFTDREQCCHDPECGEDHAHDEHSHGDDAEELMTLMRRTMRRKRKMSKRMRAKKPTKTLMMNPMKTLMKTMRKAMRNQVKPKLSPRLLPPISWLVAPLQHVGPRVMMSKSGAMQRLPI